MTWTIFFLPMCTAMILSPGNRAPIPYSLGVRVKNGGAGVARKLKIDSAQPKIVNNQQGLLIGFNIQSTEVNGSRVSNSLLADFGNIQPTAPALPAGS